jgi:hypothetical protein
MRRVRCPICDCSMDSRGPKEWPDWPLCSPRCRLIDLGRWLGEEYRAVSPLLEDPEGDDVPAPPKPAVPSADLP